MRRNAIAGNMAGEGGGVATEAAQDVSYPYDYYGGDYGTRLHILHTTISGNEAADGGVHLNRQYEIVRIEKTTVNGNTATGQGGGIFGGFPNPATARIANSTISGNTAGTVGGGIRNEEMSFDLFNTTIIGNSAGVRGDGIVTTGGGGLDLYGSIVSGNAAPLGREWYEELSSNIRGDHNIVGRNGNAGTYDYDNLGPPDLDPTDIVPAQSLAQIVSPTLRNLCGFTSAHALPTGSAALDTMPEAECSPSPVNGKDQRDKNRTVNAINPNTNSDCDRGAVERQLLLVNLHLVLNTNTAIGSSIFQPNDILAYDGQGWSLFFDGATAGLPAKARIVALDVPDSRGDDARMAFAATTAVPGLGRVTANDVVHYDGDAFWLLFDGSDVGLSQAGERIDGLDARRGAESPVGANCAAYLLISTVGNGSVPGANGRPLRFEAADVLGFCQLEEGATTRGVWHLAVDASAEGMPAGAATSLASMTNGDIYLSAAGDFFVDDAAGRDPSLIYRLRGGHFTGPEIVPADADVFAAVAAFDVEE